MVRSAAIFLPLITLLAGCSLGQHSTAASAVGDTCVVGSWTMVDETNSSGYTFANVPVAVEGLRGARLTITSSGDEKEVFDGSAPLVGTLADGRQLVITIGGSFDFQIRAQQGTYTETGTETVLPTTATAGGIPVTDYRSQYAPGSGTYSCSSSSLSMTTRDGVQTAHWSRT